jgi:regulator of protease activity HflC (stomatin/prohibitin superfamily)
MIPAMVGAILVLIIVLAGVKLVRQGEVLVVERLGRFHSVASEGLNIIIPFLDSVRNRVDMREQVRDFEPVATITKDNVGVQIDSVVYFTVLDPRAYTYGASHPIAAISTLTATTLRNEIGGMELDETLTSRDQINNKLKAALDMACDVYGIRVTRVEIKNITPPRDILDTMEKQLRAERERRESILKAEGDKRSSILRAEGEKESAILQAEAGKERAIREAEGDAEARRIQAEAEAKALLLVAEAQAKAEQILNEALAASKPTKEVVALRALEAVKAMADGKATKLVIPSELAGLGSLAALMKEVAGGDR